MNTNLRTRNRNDKLGRYVIFECNMSKCYTLKVLNFEEENKERKILGSSKSHKKAARGRI